MGVLSEFNEISTQIGLQDYKDGRTSLTKRATSLGSERYAVYFDDHIYVLLGQPLA